MRLHLISDFLIAAAYFVIPMALLLFVRKRRDLPFNWMFVCFGVFIVACGMTQSAITYPRAKLSYEDFTK